MTSCPIHLLLADDDPDDRLLFKEAIEELPLEISLTTVSDGEQLMKLLTRKNAGLPHVLFLDFNMPRKNGFECLTEIKLNENLKAIPVIIYSTSFDPEMVNILYNSGARHYIRKPAEFAQLKKVIHDALLLIRQLPGASIPKENFILQS